MIPGFLLLAAPVVSDASIEIAYDARAAPSIGGPTDPESAAMQSCARKSETPGAAMNRLRIAVVAMALSGPAFAQAPPAAAPPAPDFSEVEIKTTDLGDNCYMLEGQGGNITVAVAKRRDHHGGRRIRATARQDQGRDRGRLEPADQISHQHAFSPRSHRLAMTLRQGRRQGRRPNQRQEQARGGNPATD